MSMILTAQAMKLKIGNPARKLVLLKLADNANDEGVCFPSYQYIADHCEITKRSAITHIEKLIEMGLVSKKARKNKDGSSSNLYYLHLDKGSENISPPPVKSFHSPSENISPPPSEMVSPITNHSINQSINQKNKQKKSAELDLLAEFGITGQQAEDFMILRKAKKAPITKTALNLLQKQADLAKLPLREVVDIMIKRNWQGFNANWGWQDGANVSNGKGSNPSFSDENTDWWVGKTIEIRGQK